MANNGVVSNSEEFPCSVAPTRILRAFYEGHTLIPHIMPHTIKSVDLHYGDGIIGSLRLVSFVEGSMKKLKYIIRKIDWENLMCKYTVFDCDAYSDKLDYVNGECKFEESAEYGRSLCKIISHYHPKGDAKLEYEEDIKAAKEKTKEFYNFVHAYLADNPHVCA
ncbi:hypothetical protein MKW94_006593 [Papaver nudicaule]|uniref:Bet v I/Major latex protein domain-containing protein n=1 Tax=Papaver nudicaule TaxID=74823 RepID=A0AA41SJH1_PAPNU|nr:hypothetical protein [Papaver nudicaule]